MWIVLLFFINIYLGSNGEETSLKIKLVSSSYDVSRQLRAANSACKDYENVSRPYSESMADITEWSPRVRFYRSSYLVHEVYQLLKVKRVPGLSIHVSNVLDTYVQAGCPVFVHGGVIRDLFLGNAPNDVDAKVGCNSTFVNSICHLEWGNDLCYQFPIGSGKYVVQVGARNAGEVVDIAETGQLFGPVTDLEYSANALAFDYYGSNLTYDLTGRGVRDVCDMVITIPSDDFTDSIASWDRWRITGNNVKLFRYWKLRVKGFSASTVAVRSYIVSHVKIILSNNSGLLGFKRFFCSAVFGSQYNNITNMCTPANAETCTDKLVVQNSYHRELSEDLGTDYVISIRLPQCAMAKSSAGSIFKVVEFIQILSSVFFVNFYSY